MRGNILEATKTYQITAILRGIAEDRICQVIDALYHGGIRFLEITFNQKSETRMADTVKTIRYAKAVYGKRDACFPKGNSYLLVLPGSHTKFVSVDKEGKIRSCLTTITGELLASITNHTIIADAVGRQFAAEEEYVPDDAFPLSAKGAFLVADAWEKKR